MKTKETEYALFNHFNGTFPLITTNIIYLKDFIYHECDLYLERKIKQLKKSVYNI